ncbi:MAG: nicotinate (nicotinamide) nucleotide adenylyltransferase [Blastocatellia bacterium AA13]|nr:MAG: nicotinate (nicotinamide) nucleotide adenylyltransferase [Blastocatellia bacterium AA13]
MHSNSKRIGVYGGTFDPIHNAHIKVIHSVLKQFALDELLIVPSLQPPHKRPDAVLDSYHRYAMAVLATADLPQALVSTMELDEPSRPYTFETIQRLRKLAGREASIFFIMGMDSYLEFPDWKNPGLILLESNLIVVTRGAELSIALQNRRLPAFSNTGVIDLRADSSTPNLDNERSGAVFLTDYGTGVLSSTEIRSRIRAAAGVDDLVPAQVVSYIKKYRLYIDKAS